VRFLLRTKVHYLVACIALSSSFVAGAGVTPELQHAIRDATFEVVMKKPEKDPVTYEKALPIDMTLTDPWARRFRSGTTIM
jgi:hypothetical protein